MDQNIHNTVDYLHQKCKDKGIDFICYVGGENDVPGMLTVTTKSKKVMVDDIAFCANKDNGLIDLFKRIFTRLKRPYLWN